MKDLLSKRHFWYKIDTLLAKGSAYPPFYRHPQFYKKISSPPFYDFSKISTPPINYRGITLRGNLP